MYAAELPRFGRRGLRPRRPKNGVAARAASTIRNCIVFWFAVQEMVQ